MKKNRTMRAAVLMLALTLITSCFVGSTFAKYTTGISGSDTARVAKFGVELTFDSALFEKQYSNNAGTDVTVLADDSTDVIAPGTNDDAVIFTISGAPEVDVNVSITLNNGSALKMVTLTAGDDYEDYTTVDASGNPGTFDLAQNYYPVKWTLQKKAPGAGDFTNVDGCVGVNLAAINTYLESLNGRYEVDAEGVEKKFSDIIGEYKLTWTWSLTGNDAADTLLGQIAAGVATAPAGHVGNETFSLKITVEQVD